MNAKELINRNAKAKTKFSYTDRMQVTIIKDTFVKEKNGSERPLFKVGMVIRPHRLIAEQLIKEKTAVPTKN
jgi:hypothetical protein